MYMLICICSFHDSLTLTKKITLIDNAMELNMFYVASLYFSYLTKRLYQVQNFWVKLQRYVPFNKVMSYFASFSFPAKLAFD